jgi:branched-chain amino acid transport system ATP-binding protein
MLDMVDIEVFYGRVHALKGITLHIGEGEIVTLIGANGAGKSTILNTVCGMVRSSSGKITFLHNQIDRLPSHAIIKMGITQIPEGRRIFPDMSVEENLRIGAHTFKDQNTVKQRMDRIMKLFPILRERRTQMGGTLSGGEQQMLAIGRGMMAMPKLMLLDEPSLGLAPLLVKEVARMIREIHEQGLTVLLVEQNANMALRIANRGYVLETGRVVMTDSGKNLLNSNEVRRAYLGA